ncbi:MAG TPA: DUF222 domain-containing protein, partial [Micrococcaceae bacterium]|nr:DUF222 domain-containing protein [Micrococcaceae bacterium]
MAGCVADPVVGAVAQDALEGLAGPEVTALVAGVGRSVGMGGPLAVIDEQLQQLLETDVGAVADAAWLPVLTSLEQLRRRLSAVYLRSLAAADQVHAYALSPLGTRSSADFLKHGAGIEPSRAKADLAAARALHTGPVTDGALVRQARVDAGPLRGMAAALAAGAISGAQVATGVGVLEKLPCRLLTEANTEAIGVFLTAQAPSHSTRRFAEIAAYLVRSLAAGEDDFYDPEAVLRRKLTMGVDITGMVFGSYQLDPVAGASFRAVLEPMSAPNPDQRGPDGVLQATDDRSPDQRRADALVELAQAAAAYLGIPA